MAAIWPGAVASTLQLLTAVNNTKVTLTVDAGIGDTTLTVDDASQLPASGYVTFDDNATSPETIYYTGRTTNNLTGVTRAADGTTAAIHSSAGSNTHIEQRWNAAYHNTLNTEIVAIEQNLSDRIGVDSGSHVLLAANGAVGAPSYSFANSATTGLYRIGADDVAIANAGVKTIEFNATNQVIVPKTTNQLILGTTNTVTISATAPSVSRTWTISDIAGNGTFAALEGTQTFSGAKTFSSAVTISPVTNQLVLGTTNTTTISATAPSASRTYTIPDAGGAATFILSVGATFAGNVAMGTNKLTGLGAGTTAGDSLRYEQLFTSGTVTMLGNLAFTSSSFGIVGITGGGQAAAGHVGEIISSTVGATSAPTTGHYDDLTTISVTAGAWLIFMVSGFNLNGATVIGNSYVDTGITTTAGDSAAGLITGDSLFETPTPSGATSVNVAGAVVIFVTPSSTTTYRLKMGTLYSAGTPKFYGKLIALRIA